MDASALQSLKSHYISKVKALEGPSVLISSILKAIVDSRVIDETIALHGLSPVLPIDLDAGRLLDSSHLSMALHAFFAAKLQNIELDMLKEPPRTLDVVGDFHCAAFSVDITAFFNPPPPRFFSTKVRAVFKRYMISLGKRIFFQVLNAFILVKAGRSGNIVLYGTLYNVQPKMSSIATAFQLVKRSIAGNFVSIEYLAFSISLARCSHLMSLSLRGALEQGFIKMLSAKFPQLGADIADLSKYLASTIPISNLEGRPENFNIALTYAKSLRPKMFVSSNGYISETHTSYLAAACHQYCQTITFGIQHGGYYGYTKNHGHASNTEYQILDYLATWGWDAKSTFLGPIRTKLIPIGSFHLDDLAKSGRHLNRDQSGLPAQPKVLFVAGPFLANYIRCEQQIGKKMVEITIFPLNTDALAEFCIRSRGQLDLKGGYTAEIESEYFHNVELRSKELGIPCNRVDPKLSAYRIFSEYDVVVFDCIGTGFFEAIALGVPTFLLPSARFIPLRNPSDQISERFFTDNFNDRMNIFVEFEAAKAESADFLMSYGKKSEIDLFDFIIDFNSRIQVL